MAVLGYDLNAATERMEEMKDRIEKTGYQIIDLRKDIRNLTVELSEQRAGMPSVAYLDAMQERIGELKCMLDKIWDKVFIHDFQEETPHPFKDDTGHGMNIFNAKETRKPRS